MSKEAMKLALEWIEKQPEEITASKYDDNSRYVVIKELEAALANQEQANFCECCGKRLGKNDWDIHTCTPPQPKQEQDQPLPVREQIYKDAFEQGVHEGNCKAMNQCRLEYFNKIVSLSNKQEHGEPVAWMRMPKVGDRVVCIEDEDLGTVQSLTAGGSPDIKFDDGSHGTYLLCEFAELFRYTDTTPQQRKPLTDKQKSDLSFIANISQDMSPVEIYLQGIADAEAAHGIKE